MQIGYSSNGFEGEGSHRFTRRSGLEGTVDGLRGGSRDIPGGGDTQQPEILGIG